MSARHAREEHGADVSHSPAAATQSLQQFFRASLELTRELHRLFEAHVESSVSHFFIGERVVSPLDTSPPPEEPATAPTAKAATAPTRASVPDPSPKEDKRLAAPEASSDAALASVREDAPFVFYRGVLTPVVDVEQDQEEGDEDDPYDEEANEPFPDELLALASVADGACLQWRFVNERGQELCGHIEFPTLAWLRENMSHTFMEGDLGWKLAPSSGSVEVCLPCDQVVQGGVYLFDSSGEAFEGPTSVEAVYRRMVEDLGLPGWTAGDDLHGVALTSWAQEILTELRAPPNPFRRVSRRRLLAKAYRQTDFTVDDGAAGFVIGVGGRTPNAFNALLFSRRLTSWAYITAWNPGSEMLPLDANKRRQADLKEALTAYPTFPGIGRPRSGTWPGEESVLVLGIERDVACRLAASFGQAAIVVNAADGTPELVFLEDEPSIREDEAERDLQRRVGDEIEKITEDESGGEE